MRHLTPRVPKADKRRKNHGRAKQRKRYNKRQHGMEGNSNLPSASSQLRRKVGIAPEDVAPDIAVHYRDRGHPLRTIQEMHSVYYIQLGRGSPTTAVPWSPNVSRSHHQKCKVATGKAIHKEKSAHQTKRVEVHDSIDQP